MADYAQVPGWQKLSGAPWTIGYGHTGPEVHPGLVIVAGQAEMMLAADIAKVKQGLSTRFPWWTTLDDVRQDALVNMAFNLGVHGLEAFPDTMAALQAGKWDLAANDLEGDLWARQVGARATRIVALIRTGKRLA